MMRGRARVFMKLLSLGLIAGLLIFNLSISTISIPAFPNFFALSSNTDNMWTTPLNMSIVGKSSLTSVSERSIAVDSQDDVHFVYYGYSDNKGGNYEIYYWTNKGGSWTWANVSNVNESSLHQWRPVIAIDSNGVVHAVWQGYYEAGGKLDLFYSNNAGGNWTPPYNITKSNGISEWDPSIIFDSSGMLYLAYHTEAGGTVKYVTRSSDGLWSAPVEVNTSPYNFDVINEGLSLVIDSENNLYIAFSAYNKSLTQTELYLVNNSVGSWSTPYNVSHDLASESNTDWWQSMTVDSEDNIHVVWESTNGTNAGVKYANNSAGAWSEPVFINSTDAGPYWLFPSVITDVNDAAHVAFSQKNETGGNYEVFYVNNTAGSFGTPVNVTKTKLGDEIRPDILIDLEGYVHILYYNRTEVPYYIQYMKTTEPVVPPPPFGGTPAGLMITNAIILVVIIGVIAFAVVKRTSR